MNITGATGLTPAQVATLKVIEVVKERYGYISSCYNNPD